MKFPPDSVYLKLLKSVHFSLSYSKYKRDRVCGFKTSLEHYITVNCDNRKFAAWFTSSLKNLEKM